MDGLNSGINSRIGAEETFLTSNSLVDPSLSVHDCATKIVEATEEAFKSLENDVNRFPEKQRDFLRDHLRDHLRDVAHHCIRIVGELQLEEQLPDSETIVDKYNEIIGKISKRLGLPSDFDGIPMRYQDGFFESLAETPFIEDADDPFILASRTLITNAIDAEDVSEEDIRREMFGMNDGRK